MCFAMKIVHVDCTHVLRLAKAQWAGHVQDLYQTRMHPHSILYHLYPGSGRATDWHTEALQQTRSFHSRSESKHNEELQHT